MGRGFFVNADTAPNGDRHPSTDGLTNAPPNRNGDTSPERNADLAPNGDANTRAGAVRLTRAEPESECHAHPVTIADAKCLGKPRNLFLAHEHHWVRVLGG